MNGFCERLKSERLRAKLTQKEVAEKIGFTRQTYIRYEKGIIKQIDIDDVIKFCKILNTSPDYLFWGKRTITDSMEVWHLIRNIESNIEEIKTMLKGN